MLVNLHTTLVGFWNILASHRERSAFKPRFAIPLRLLVQGCPFLRNPFDGEKVLRTFSLTRLTHSDGYASAADCPTCFASLRQKSKSW